MEDDMEDIQAAPNTSNDTISLSQQNSLQQTPSPSVSTKPSDNLALPSSSSTTNTNPEAEPSDLMSENTRLKEQRTCKICMDGEVGVVFLPCGHLCSCVNCAPALKVSFIQYPARLIFINYFSQDCPVCRRAIQGTVRTFLS